MKETGNNGTAGGRLRRKYDETFKKHAVELTLRRDRSAKSVAQEIGIPAWLLYEWRRRYAPRPGGGPKPATLEEAQAEVERLRAELVRMREREIVLKKSLGILSETPGRGMP